MELRSLNTIKSRVNIPFSKFKTDGFRPRGGFKARAYQVLEDIIGKMPADANVTAECKKRFGKYYFKITVVGSNANFEASTVLDPLTEDTSSRDWLNRAIEGLHNSMNTQINDWLQSRSLEC